MTRAGKIGHRVEFEAKGQATLKTFAVPPPKPGEVLLENDYTVISPGTETANLLQLPNTGSAEHGFPHAPGYSGAGRVVAVGQDVADLTVGDRVVIPWGGHRSHTVLQAKQVQRIENKAVETLDAALAPIATFPLLGLRKLKLELGESAAIAGQGILGVFALQMACLSGALPVVATDFNPTRRALALQLGATAAFSPDEEDVVHKIREATGGEGPNAVVEVTGAAAALQQALEYIAWEGRISLLGCTRVSDAPIDYYKYVHRRGISLIGAHTFARPEHDSAPGRWTERDDCRTFLKLVAAGKLQTQPLVSEVVSPEAAPTVYRRLAETSDPPLGIVFDWSTLR